MAEEDDKTAPTSLQARIRSAQGKAHGKDPASKEDPEDMRRGVTAGAELVGAVLAGGLIGWFLDDWLGTKPLFLLIFLLLGVATGFYNIYRMDKATPPLHPEEKQAKHSAGGTNSPSRTERSDTQGDSG